MHQRASLVPPATQIPRAGRTLFDLGYYLPSNCDRLKRAGAVETTRCFAPAALAVAVSHSLIPTAIRFSTRTVVSLSAGPSS